MDIVQLVAGPSHLAGQPGLRQGTRGRRVIWLADRWRHRQIKHFGGHLEDMLHSVIRSPQYLGEVAGEYAQAIRDQMPEIVGIVAGFIMAEATSAFLAATPTRSPGTTASPAR